MKISHDSDLATEGGGILADSVYAVLVLGKPAMGKVDAHQINVGLIGFGYWQSRFGGVPEVVGRSLRVNGIDREIIGVMPPNFGFPYSQDVWLPLDPAADLAAGGLEVVGRLSAGAAPADAVDELQAIWVRRDELRTPENRGGQVSVANSHKGAS